MTIASDVIPTPADVQEIDGTTRLRSVAGDLVFSHLPDPDLQPRTFVYTWRDCRAEVAGAIRRHHREHVHATFPIKIPRTGEVVQVQWSAPPSIQWRTAVAASATAEFEEALAY